MVKLRESGFSLLEMLAVVAIFMILAIISVIAWRASAPGMILESSAKALGSMIEQCMSRAVSQHTEYFVILNYRAQIYQTTAGPVYHFPTNSYVAVNDDGWSGNGIRKYNEHTKFGGDQQEFAPIWYPDEEDYVTNIRFNNLLEPHELYQGPIKLGQNIVFIDPPDGSMTVKRIVFSYRQPIMYWQSSQTPDNKPIFSENRITETAKIYMVNQNYKMGDNSKDNRAHLRLVRVNENSVIVTRPG